ncbi:MAG: sigma-70 family RNA polymerase sigma factor [Firmicutes bacterium]|nr:sigma-70 family RNA polymerase sigma factor [Bacillota bacterium]
MAEQHIGLVRHALTRMEGLLRWYVESEDLMGYGMIGLMEALERFDPACGRSFSCFAFPRILGSMTDGAYKSVGISRRMGRKLIQAAYEEESPGESASRQGMRTWDEAVCDLWAFTLDAPGEALQYDEDPVAEACICKMRREALAKALEALSETERQVLWYIYAEGGSFRAAGRHFGISRYRAERIAGKALRTVRENFMSAAE